MKNISAEHNATTKHDMKKVGHLVKSISIKLNNKLKAAFNQLNLTKDEIKILRKPETKQKVPSV